jgi:hypothetical protein
MIDRNVALGHHVFKVLQAQRRGYVPVHAGLWIKSSGYCRRLSTFRHSRFKFRFTDQIVRSQRLHHSGSVIATEPL